LPYEYEKTIISLDMIIKTGWSILNNMNVEREKVAALALIKDAYVQKFELLTDVDVINDVMRWTQSHTKENIINGKKKVLEVEYNNDDSDEDQDEDESETETETENGKQEVEEVASEPLDTVF
jgi:hypothetical protein